MTVIMLGAIFLVTGGALIAFPQQIRKVDIGANREVSGYTGFLRFLGVIFVLLALLMLLVGLCPHGC